MAIFRIPEKYFFIFEKWSENYPWRTNRLEIQIIYQGRAAVTNVKISSQSANQWEYSLPFQFCIINFEFLLDPILSRNLFSHKFQEIFEI